MDFLENDIVLRFPVMSDLHIMGKGMETSGKLDSAFKYLKQFGKMDAIFFPGDLTDFGMPEQMAEFRDIMYKHFDPDQTRLLLSIGNHELYRHELMGAPLTVGEDFYNTFDGKVFTGASKEDIHTGRYLTTVNGFAFIMISAYKYSGGVDFKKEDLIWLEESLQKAEKETDSSKPIFVCAHSMIVDTCYGSNFEGGDGGYWSSSLLYPILAKHPRSIYFSGHLHFPLQHSKDIWQKEFTAIGTSSVYFASLENNPPEEPEIVFSDIVTGSEPADNREYSQGLLVEIDSKNQTRITRLDFYRESQILEPWYIPACDQNNCQLKPYSDEEMAKRMPKPPVFPKDAVIIESSKDIEAPLPDYRVKFTAAVSDEMIESYRLSFVDCETNEVLKTIGLYSDFYRADKIEDMSKTVEKPLTIGKLSPFTPYGEGSYRLEVVAADFYNQKSEPLCSAPIKRKACPSPDPYMIKPENAKYINLINFANYKPTDELKELDDFLCWPPTAGGKAVTPLIMREEDGKNMLEMTINSGEFQFYQFYSPEKLSFETASQFSVKLNCKGTHFKSMYFTVIYEGQEYSTLYCNGYDIKAYITDENGTKSVYFNYDGCVPNFGDFDGTIRFSTLFFRNQITKAPLPFDKIEAFRIGFNGEDDIVGKKFSFGDVNFIL